jgi:hypothetical protein
MDRASLDEKFASFSDHWRPKVVAKLNGQEVKLVKFAGTFPWHHHESADELFLVWRGEMSIEFRDRRVDLKPGDFCVVPRGVEHRTMAGGGPGPDLRPAQTRNTGNVVDDVHRPRRRGPGIGAKTHVSAPRVTARSFHGW